MALGASSYLDWFEKRVATQLIHILICVDDSK